MKAASVTKTVKRKGRDAAWWQFAALVVFLLEGEGEHKELGLILGRFL